MMMMWGFMSSDVLGCANKQPGKKSFVDKNMKNPTGINLCTEHKIATSRGPPLKSYCPDKSNYINYLQQIN